MNEEQHKKAVAFLQGDGVLEDGMMHALKSLKESMWNNWDVFIGDAQALCAIFMLVFFAIKSYEMMAGDKPLEIMPLLRPFGLLMIILWWSTFTHIVAFPTDIIANKAETMSEESFREVNNLLFVRAKLVKEISIKLVTVQAETEVASQETGNMVKDAVSWVSSKVKDGLSTVWNSVAEMRLKLQVGMNLLLTQLIETMGLWFLRVCVYFLFMFQIITSTILIILGPFAVAMSILPAFRDSFSTWVGRFISCNLYLGIGYIVLYIVSLFMQYSLEAEIERYTHLIKEANTHGVEALAAYAGNGVMSFGMVIISFIVGGLVMLTVPSMSTWIVSTSGVTSAASTLGRNVGGVMQGMKMVAGKI